MAGEEATAVFGFDIDPSGAQEGADAAASSVENLQQQLDEGTAALAEMNKAMRLLKGGASTDIEAFKALRDAIAAKKTTLSQTTAELLNQGKAQDVLRNKSKEGAALAKKHEAEQKERDKVAKAHLDAYKKGEAEKKKATAEAAKQQKASADALKQQHEAMSKSIGQLGGPLQGLLGQFQGLKSLVAGGAIAAGTLAIVAAFLALAAGVAVAIAALTKYAIVAADVRRSEMLQLEALTKTRNWYGIAAGKATDLQHAIDSVSDSVSLGRDHVNGMATSLYQMGLRGENLKQALAGVEMATDAAGEAQGAFYKGMIMSAARSGVALKRVTDDIKARFGEIAARKAMGLEVQLGKLKQNFDALFRDVKIEGFLKALQSVTSLLSQTSVEGRALKQLLTIVLNPFIGSLEHGAPIAKKFFQGMILQGQELMMALLILAITFKKAFSGEVLKGIDKAQVALTLGKWAAFGLASAILAVGIAFGVVALVAVAAFSLMMAPILVVVAAIVGATMAVQRLVGAFAKVGEKLRGLNWADIGVGLVKGLVFGISNSTKYVVDAVIKLGTDAKDALKKVWDSHSPSRLFFKIGGTAPEGAEGGILAGIPGVKAASEELGEAATLGYNKPEGGASPALPRVVPDAVQRPAASSGGVSNVIHVTIKADTEAGGRAAAKGFEEQLGDVLRGVSIKFGAPRTV